MKRNNSSYGAYSLYIKVRQMLISGKELDIYRLVAKATFNKAPSYSVKECKRIFNEINNCYYSYRQMILYMFYRYLTDSKVPRLNDIKHKNIHEMMRLFTKKQYKEDKKFLSQVMKKTDLSDREMRYKAIVHLTKEKYISPSLFLDILRKKFLTERDENDIFTDENLGRFLFTAKKMNSIITEVMNEQEKVRNRLEQRNQED